MNTKSAVLFDLDGTLVDTAPDFILAVNKQRHIHGFSPLNEMSIRNTVSEGARALVSLSFSCQENEDRFLQKHNELLALYMQHIADNSRLFPGMDDLLHWLEAHQIPWGIVTNKPRRFSEPLLDGLRLSERCQALVCPDDVVNKKPDPEPLYLACSILQADPLNTVYIGDHNRDIEAGRRAGMKTIAATYGYIPETDNVEDWKADYNAPDCQVMRRALQSIFDNYRPDNRQ